MHKSFKSLSLCIFLVAVLIAQLARPLLANDNSQIKITLFETLDEMGLPLPKTATANYIGRFEVLNDDGDFSNYLPHDTYHICLQESSAFALGSACDLLSYTHGLGSTRGIVPFEEALLPLRGERIKLWIQALNIPNNQFDVSHAHSMYVPLSNIALRPPGYLDVAPYNLVYPTPDVQFDSVGAIFFVWPLTTTNTAGQWGGNNNGATAHILSIDLQQTSAICNRITLGCPDVNNDNVCLSTDPLTCEGAQGFCSHTESCSKHSGIQRFHIPLGGLTQNDANIFDPTGIHIGRGRVEQISNFTYVVFSPEDSILTALASQVKADRMHWQVAVCRDINDALGVPQFICGKPENSFVHYGIGLVGIPALGNDPPDDPTLTPGVAFGDSPLVDTFSHPACIQCHVLEPEALAGVGIGSVHNNLVSGGVANFSNPAFCIGCHDSGKAPPILVDANGVPTAFSFDHELGTDYDVWWEWFAPEYDGALEWPDFLKDDQSEDYDPATACVKFKGANPTAESMKEHLFTDPRVIWAIVGGLKPGSAGFIDQLAPPGSALTASSLLADRLAVLETWEDWVNDWVDGGMNCGSTYSAFGVGGGSNEAVNTTPPITGSDGSSGTYVGGDMGSEVTTQAHLDCSPDQDSASDRCDWTFFACGSDLVAVQSLIEACTEETAQHYWNSVVPFTTVPDVCDKPISSCYKRDPGGGGLEPYWSVVHIPAEIGDTTYLKFFSIDAEGNQEAVRSEFYKFVEEDLIAPVSSAELIYDLAAGEHKLRFSCTDNSEDCVIFVRTNDPEDDVTPRFNMTNQILNFNPLGFLRHPDNEIRRIRWAAIDGAVTKNVEFDRLCVADNLALCPGKQTEQDVCVTSCEADIRNTCEMGCPAKGAGDATPVPDCVSECIDTSPTDCLAGCAQSCDDTFTECPGTGGLIDDCNDRAGEIQCYHEFAYDPVVYLDPDPPEVDWEPTLQPRPDGASEAGTYESGFRVSLLCTDPVNECEIYYTLDGSEPTEDPRLLYTTSIPILEPTTGRTATTTLKYLAVDNAVPPNHSALETKILTIALPHTDDDGDTFTEPEDCNDDNNQIHPNATEICDLIDNNCDGSINEGLFCGETTVSSSGLAFGSQQIANGATAPQTVTITNDGIEDLDVSSVVLQGSDAADFNIEDDTGESVLAPMANRMVMVNFDPGSIGAKNATLRIISNDTDEAMVDVPLTGTGIAPTSIDVSPASLTFGSQLIASGASSAQNVTITNTGAPNLNIISVSLSGANSADFGIESDSGEVVLATGEVRTVMVYFEPSSVGAKTAELSIVSDDTSEPAVDVALSGEGLSDVVFKNDFESGDTSRR